MASSKSPAQWKDDIETIINIPEEIEPALWPECCCIYKVPENLRMGNPEAYTPKLISIGPIHHGKPELKQMEQQKQRYFLFFSERLSKTEEESCFHKLRSYKDFVGTHEEKIRRCYSEKYPDLNKDQFVEMILLDTVFIMELFLRQSEWQNYIEGDPLFSKLWLNKGIEQDLLLLENQVPIFLLNELYDSVVLVPGCSKQSDHESFLILACEYFKSYYPWKSSSERNQTKTIIPQEWNNSKHFIDLIRYFRVPRDLSYDGDLSKLPVLETATKLQEAGVSFEAVSDKCLLDIQFKKKPFLNWFLCLGCFPCSNCVKARFQFPQLKVDGTTERVFRNLIALEQCHYPRHHYICNYVSVLDYLINSKEDVELLVEKGVIVHQLGSDKEMATMINGLCKHVVIQYACYGKIQEELKEHYDDSWKHFMGIIRWVYFRDLWRSSTTIVVVVVFLFSVVSFFRGIGVIHVKSSALKAVVNAI